MERIFELEVIIKDIENNFLLFEEKNFLNRIETIDFLTFQIIGELKMLQAENSYREKCIQLTYRIEKIIAILEKINDKIFSELLENIRKEKIIGKEFNNLVEEYFDFDLYRSEYRETIGYDALDVFFDRLFPQQVMPDQTKNLEQGMVDYQKTPARIIFEFIDKIDFQKDDVFFDLGSGLGQVAILVNLLCGIKTKGVEIEPAFCDYARQSAAAFNLRDIIFINADARNVDYSEGTIFFMFTPFKDQMLENVLDILHKQSKHRKIKIITYGPCSTYVASQSWLKFFASDNIDIYEPGIFINLPAAYPNTRE